MNGSFAVNYQALCALLLCVSAALYARPVGWSFEPPEHQREVQGLVNDTGLLTWLKHCDRV
jgi:hypothetical protein